MGMIKRNRIKRLIILSQVSFIVQVLTENYLNLNQSEDGSILQHYFFVVKMVLIQKKYIIFEIFGT
jgi:hypothetical protein